MQHLMMAASFIFVSASANASDSLCSPDERVVFSCVAGKGSKVVSMCASPGLTGKSGTLYYRFGTSSNVELEYPTKPNGSAQRFKYAHYSRFQTERTEVTFEVGKFTYAVFDYYDENEKPQISRGVRVTSEGGGTRETTISCKASVTAKLQQLEGKVPCDSQSALAQCN